MPKCIFEYLHAVVRARWSGEIVFRAEFVRGRCWSTCRYRIWHSGAQPGVIGGVAKRAATCFLNRKLLGFLSETDGAVRPSPPKRQRLGAPITFVFPSRWLKLFCPTKMWTIGDFSHASPWPLATMASPRDRKRRGDKAVFLLFFFKSLLMEALSGQS